MAREHKATERRNFEESLEALAVVQARVDRTLARLRRIQPSLQPNARLLDIGAGPGLVLVAFAKRGLQVVGVEPWDQARQVAQQIADHEGVQITILPGTAEKLPLASESFHIVHSQSVIEHVQDPQAMLDEAYRVLKPGGVVRFNTASAVCPRQQEIRGFPCFGWYPDRLKRRIMYWARDHRPELVGYTQTPAINWFTTPRARRMLRKAGFTGRVYDCWDLRLTSEGGPAYALALRLIRTTPVTRFLANVLFGACTYAAIKQ